MAILILCSDWWSDYRGKGIWGNRADYQNTSLLDGNLRICIIRWGAARLKKTSLHDELHTILSLYASWKPFCYFSLTVSEDYPGFWKNQVLLLLLPPPFLPWRLRGAIVVHAFPRLWPAPGPATQHQQQGSALWKRSLVQSVGSSGCLL